jgi:ATP-dependent Lhr-like helicase
VSELPGLHPSLAHHLLSTLGWTELRPLQREAIEPIRNGDDVVLLAPRQAARRRRRLSQS